MTLQTTRARIICLAFTAWMLVSDSQSIATTSPAAAQDLQRVELVIENYDFVLPRPVALRLGMPTALILRNQDIVRHGLTAPVFTQMHLRVEGEGLAAYGNGIEGVHVDPGKTLVLYFTPERGGTYTFHCDLHPQMKGELFSLDLPAA